MKKVPKIFSPSPGVDITSCEELLVYYHSFIDYQIDQKTKEPDDANDLFQEISLGLLGIWRKYEKGEIPYLTSSYINISVKNILKNYFVRTSRDIDKTQRPFRHHVVLEASDKIIDQEKFIRSMEDEILFKEIEAKVTSQLDLFELQFFDLLKQGHTRAEIFQRMRFGDKRKYIKIVTKIRKLFTQYAKKGTGN